MDVFVVMTLEVPMPGGGVNVQTKSRVLTVEPGATRASIYDHMRGKFSSEFASSGNVLCFTVDPNHIGG